MKTTTRNEVSDMIEEATDKLRKELYLRKASDNDATAQLVESTADYLKQYVRDMTRAPTMRPADPAVRWPAPKAVGSPLKGDPSLYQSNVELIHHVAYTDGHAAALTKVLDLLNDTPIRVPRSMVAKAIRELSL